VTLTADQRETLRAAARAELARRGLLDVRRDLEQIPTILDEDGVTVHPLHVGQLAAFSSIRRIVAIFAGWQSGKTVIGPWWLIREIQRRGPGDYAVIGPDYPMILNKAKPEMAKAFAGLYHSSGNEWVLTKAGELAIFGAEQSSRTRILFRHAQAPEAIEAFTLKGLWIDEPGQIADAVWRAIKPRCMVHRARMLLTARPYEHNWYVRDIWDPVMTTRRIAPYVYEVSRRADAPDDIEVINFDSETNPQSDPEFIAGERSGMPEAEYMMRYMGIPLRPAGAVYDCFDTRVHVVEMQIPVEWPRYLGVDFGPDNMAFVKIAAERVSLGNGKWGPMTGNYVAYGELHGGKLTAEEHIARVTHGEPNEFTAYGGAKSTEDGWRGLYTRAGLTIQEPSERLVEVGIQYVYRLIKEGRFKVTNECPKLINDLVTYSYKLDDQGNSTGKLDPSDKAKFHLADALRYIAKALYTIAIYDDPEPVTAGSVEFYEKLGEYANSNETETGIFGPDASESWY